MTKILKPENEAQALEAVQWAAANDTPLEVLGTGTKRGLGRPVSGNATRLDLSGLAGIVFYEPEELVIRAGAGTPIAEIESLLGDHNQHLAFEPQDLNPIYGGAAGAGTIGGVIACNLSGPRRIRDGAARDHIMGFQAISGRGEVFKSGGRVMKNVTGFDLSKLMAGSFGTLAVMTEVTLKVLPRPEKTRTVLVFGLDQLHATEAGSRALGSAYDVSGACHLPTDLAGASAVTHVAGAGRAVTAVRVEGFGPSVEARCSSLRKLLGAYGETEELRTTNSLTFWHEVRDLHPLTETADTCIWRLSVAPDRGPVVINAIRKLSETARLYTDWGGGLVWASLGGADDGMHDSLHQIAKNVGGHATCMRAPEDIRSRNAVFQSESPALEALTRRIKDAFDPKKILNSGRMAEGI